MGVYSNTVTQERAIELWDVIDIVSSSFRREFNNDSTYYFVKRVFWDQTLVVEDFDTSKCYLLSWEINDAKEVTFTPTDREEWQEVEENWTPVERQFTPQLRNLFGIDGKEVQKEPVFLLEEVQKRNLHISKNTETKVSKIERRTFAVEVRAGHEDKGKNKITGYAAVFGVPTELFGGEIIEEIAPGAFDDVMNDDVRVLFNHSPDMVLGRTSSGTCRISVDEIGLRYEVDLPNTSLGRDLYESIKRGDVSQSSFGFTIKDYKTERMEDGGEKVIITKVGRLYDVAPVTFPAYETTNVNARSKEKIERKQTEKTANYRTVMWQKYKTLSKKRV